MARDAARRGCVGINVRPLEGSLFMKARVEFRGRWVACDYPARHAAAQEVVVYDDFSDGVPRDRVRYGDSRDRNPGGITYATREERIAYRLKDREKMLAALGAGDEAGRAAVDRIYPFTGDSESLIRSDEVIRTDHRCSDCDVDVGDFHLPGCCFEVCPGCGGQSISCGCDEDEDEGLGTGVPVSQE